MPLLEVVGLFAVAVLSGAVNSISGGGSLLTFPALIWIGRDPIVANATNTVTLWPGSLAAATALRRDVWAARRWLVLFFPVCVIGAVVGALLLLRTPSAIFGRLVPYLILFATGLFALQTPLTRAFPARRSDGASDDGLAPTLSGGRTAAMVAFQLAVAVYGGYFGAGIGILTLAALGLLGFTDIHQMIGIRNVNAVWINGVAGLCFATAGVVRWHDAAVLTVGQILGGYTGARLIRVLSPEVVRRAVVAIGIAMAAALFLTMA